MKEYKVMSKPDWDILSIKLYKKFHKHTDYFFNNIITTKNKNIQIGQSTNVQTKLLLGWVISYFISNEEEKNHVLVFTKQLDKPMTWKWI